uniref:Uncharacterized protein n=1 Tax=Anas platyrhynchos TaxID=8839 RepID=A0A8B9TP37_ANAPL
RGRVRPRARPRPPPPSPPKYLTAGHASARGAGRGCDVWGSPPGASMAPRGGSPSAPKNTAGVEGGTHKPAPRCTPGSNTVPHGVLHPGTMHCSTLQHAALHPRRNALS